MLLSPRYEKSVNETKKDEQCNFLKSTRTVLPSLMFKLLPQLHI